MQDATPRAVPFKTREQAAYEALRHAIVQGVLAAGQPVVISHLATDLGVSRITVTNALKRLSGEGFVHLTPHKEAIITPLEPEDVREIYLMRAELEALAAGEAAARITPADLAELHHLNDEIGRRKADAVFDIRAIRAADLAFHRRLRAITAMPFLARSVENLVDRCESFRARTLDERQIVVPDPTRHTRILAALEAHNVTEAADAMRQHVLAGMDAVLDVIASEAMT